ncbi:MAG: GNAT family protein, partial [Oscillospiraceae bacterium]
EKDIDGILEWMQDDSINRFFRFDGNSQTHSTVSGFIQDSFDDTKRHYAVVNDSDEYLGTVSLKKIDCENMNCEYAVSFRRCAHGSGAAEFATRAVLELALSQWGMEKVYLNVLASNERAIRFYEKLGAQYEGTAKRQIKINGQFSDLKWYCWLKGQI